MSQLLYWLTKAHHIQHVYASTVPLRINSEGKNQLRKCSKDVFTTSFTVNNICIHIILF